MSVITLKKKICMKTAWSEPAALHSVLKHGKNYKTFVQDILLLLSQEKSKK